MARNHVAAILTYFNFSQSREREIALELCVESLHDDLDIILVAHGDLPNFNREIQLIVVESADVLWQRERFWNLALEHLKPQHDVVAWIDSDIIFLEHESLGKLHQQLTRTPLVHLFSEVIDGRLRKDRLVRTGSTRRSIVEMMTVSPTSVVTDYFAKSGISLTLNCSPGFAWAAQAELIKRVEFPDFLILGSGDKAFLAAAFGYHHSYSAALRLNESLRETYARWGDKVFSLVAEGVGYVDTVIEHIVQGEYEDRQYGNRYDLLANPNFSVDNLMRVNCSGAWEWRERNNAFAQGVRDYFVKRHD